jgi:hypothetical protein
MITLVMNSLAQMMRESRESNNQMMEVILNRLGPPSSAASAAVDTPLNGPTTPSLVTLKPSEVYLFNPSSRQDDKSARIFVERIRDAKKAYKSYPEKLALLLPRCLDNDVAHTWYTALSDIKKDDMALDPAN